MVCLYCSGSLSVKNSRAQRRLNQTWRRRVCEKCDAVFTTLEAVDLSKAISVQRAHGLQPFSRDRLFVSIYESCRHRPRAADDARNLTDTVISQLLKQQAGGALPLESLVGTTVATLQRFDEAAAVQYAAFHAK